MTPRVNVEVFSPSHGSNSSFAKLLSNINHTLMLLVLKQYGFPPRLINVIARMYKTFKLNIKKGDETYFLEYLSGVHQGDPLAPPLFVLVYQACMETLDVVRG